MDPSPVAVKSSPGGRILPSLVPEESLRRTLRDAAPTAAKSDPPSRAPKRRDQASKSPRNSGFSSAANAPLADGLSPKSRQPSNVQSDEGAGVSPRVATTAQSQVVGDSGSLALGAKARRRDKVAISRDDVRTKRWLNDQRSAMGTDSPATLPSGFMRSARRRPLSRTPAIRSKLKCSRKWGRNLRISTANCAGLATACRAFLRSKPRATAHAGFGSPISLSPSASS